METAVCTNDTDTMRMPSPRHILKSTTHTDIPKTPESELMSVDEYFDILRKRVNDYYDSLQG